MLVPPLRRTEPPPDFIQRNIFLTKYLRIHGAIPLDTFARCHFTQELYRMKWGWEARCSYEVDPDDENPFPRYGNWVTPDGKHFFCEWYDDCPPCEDSIRGPCPPGGGDWDGHDGDGLGQRRRLRFQLLAHTRLSWTPRVFSLACLFSICIS
jgi:hypothetical protein